MLIWLFLSQSLWIWFHLLQHVWLSIAAAAASTGCHSRRMNLNIERTAQGFNRLLRASVDFYLSVHRVMSSLCTQTGVPWANWSDFHILTKTFQPAAKFTGTKVCFKYWLDKGANKRKCSKQFSFFFFKDLSDGELKAIFQASQIRTWSLLVYTKGLIRIILSDVNEVHQPDEVTWPESFTSPESIFVFPKAWDDLFHFQQMPLSIIYIYLKAVVKSPSYTMSSLTCFCTICTAPPSKRNTSWKYWKTKFGNWLLCFTVQFGNWDL